MLCSRALHYPNVHQTSDAIAISYTAQDYPGPVCDVVICDELTELEDARITVDLARSDFAAYERILKMIEKLCEAKTSTQTASGS